MEAPAALEEEFNDWYDTEHFPQRRSLPGFESATRWVCRHGWPRWAALYDLSSVAALGTPQYLAVSGANATPWSRRVLPRTIGRARIIAEQIAPGDATTHPEAETAELVIARYGQSVAPNIPELPGLLQLRWFRNVTGGESWAVAALDRPSAPDTLRAAFGSVGGAGARMLNIYQPYFRTMGYGP